MRLAVASLALLLSAEASAHGSGVAVLELRSTSDTSAVCRWTLPGGATAPGIELPEGCRLEAAELTCPLAGLALTFTSLDGPVGSVLVRLVAPSGEVTTRVADARSPRVELPDTADPGAPLWRYFGLGVAHILSGADHLLLVLGLVLLVRGRRLLMTITAFTAGHSLTLALAALGLVHFPVRAAEVVIALSVVVLAAELARPSDALASAPATLTRRRPGLVAGAFGLVHGVGFAGGLAAVGVPAGDVLPALCGFNLGVEAGQLAVVAALVLVLAVVRLRPVIPAYVMGTLAVAWTLERVVILVGAQ